MRIIPLILLGTAMGTPSAMAQSGIGKPVTLKHGGVPITLGCERSYSLDSTPVENLKLENANLDRLINDMCTELVKVKPSKEAAAWLVKEQKLWLKARSKQCRKEGKAVPRGLRTQRELGYYNWAGRCRLEELLTRYDELVPSLN